jgi:phage terminase large subunit-like protein
MVQALQRARAAGGFDRVVQSWDTANKAPELSDFNVCASWGIRGKDLLLGGFGPDERFGIGILLCETGIDGGL